MSSEATTLVKYEGDTFSVLERPSRDCKAVVDARDKMLGTVDLDGFLSHLVRVGKFVRIAYNGVAGNTDLQIQMRELGFEIADLCDESGLTMSKFRMTADSILTDLTGAYQFFLDDMEEMAITSIESIGDSAKNMATAASKLSGRFKAQKKEVLRVCKATAKEKGLEDETLEKLEREEKEMEAEAERQEKEQLLAAKLERELQKEIEAATAEEEKLGEQLATTPTDLILGVITVGLAPSYRVSKASKALGRIQDRIEKLHKNKKKEIKRHREALNKMEECAKKIAQCSNQQANVRDQAIPALHGAVGALTHLAIIMRKAATFWTTMQQMCEEQSKKSLEKQVETASKYKDPEKRLKAYQSRPVKERAVKMYVSWVAMETVCDDYIEKIKQSREELFRYLGENPTIEQSKMRILQLCTEFEEELAGARGKMDDEMKELEEEEKA